jgi:hypothetical protein
MEMPRRNNRWNYNLRYYSIAHSQRIESELDHMDRLKNNKAAKWGGLSLLQ